MRSYSELRVHASSVGTQIKNEVEKFSGERRMDQVRHPRSSQSESVSLAAFFPFHLHGVD